MTLPLSATDARALARSGTEALRRGDARQARHSFERLVASGLADAYGWLGLARACQGVQDYAAAHAAIDQALALDPSNVRALILKADHLAHEGDERSASSFYLSAVRSAPSPDRVPEDLRAELARAQQMCERLAVKFETTLRQRVLGDQVAGRPSTERFVRSLDILFGKKNVYYQQPRYYYFPELPQIQFYPRGDFPWLDRVEAATDDIRAELLDVLKEPSLLQPYVRGDPRRPHNDQQGMLNNPDWSAYYLWQEGKIVTEHAERCPATMKALENVPLAKVPNRSPSVLFSLLRPGARIPPHNGFVNTRLICHLPLIIPPDCDFRVGNDTRTPVEGKAWVFDDTIEHEAWNRSGSLRAILLFEIWRPELSEEERGLVTAMFEAIDAHTGEKAAWQI